MRALPNARTVAPADKTGKKDFTSHHLRRRVSFLSGRTSRVRIQTSRRFCATAPTSASLESLTTVPGLTTPGERIQVGTRKPPFVGRIDDDRVVQGSPDPRAS
jgi:hypothetical protein